MSVFNTDHSSRPYDDAALARIAAAIKSRPAGAMDPPEQIGPYRIVSTIGEGGMGVVYRAEQLEPIARTVALKVVRFGSGTRDVIARFESERQTLTLLDHPHIARILDAGATDTGTPYFVMEFVEGEAITAYADRKELSVPQRLELFLQACQAVQHAHLKAVIHRDLKPSNILVTEKDGTPWVKVIDFGISKVLNQPIAERALFTEVGQLVGTPEYMAPEQADDRAADIDTRVDVYALGVVLYELLSGSLPLDPRTIRGAGYAEMCRMIREVDPPRPSTKLSGHGVTASEVARRRQLSLPELEHQLQRELEWIPLKALRKEPADRYASAADFATDVANYINDRPLMAGPESRSYRLRKFIRRHRGGVVAAAGFAVLIAAGTSTTAWQAIAARRAEAHAIAQRREADAQRSRAESALANVREVNRFLTDDLLAAASPEIARGREVTIREAVDRASTSVGNRFESQPITEAAVRSTLADVYSALGRYELSLPHARAAAELLRRAAGPDDAETLAADAEVGRQLAAAGKADEAEPLLRNALDRTTRLLGPDHETTLKTRSALGMALRVQQRYDDAEPVYREALAADTRVHGPRSQQRAKSLNNLALLMVLKGRRAEAEPLYREALDLKRELMGTDHPSYLVTLGNLARVVEDQGKIEEAESLMTDLLAADRRVLGEDHPSTLLTMNNLSIVLASRGKLDESEAMCRDVLARRRRVLGEEHPDTLQSISNLGTLLTRRNKLTEAEPLVRESVEKRSRVLGEAHAYTLGSMINLAKIFEQTGRAAEAEPIWAKLCEPANLAKQQSAQQAAVLARYGISLLNRGDVQRAEPLLVDAERRFREETLNSSETRLETLRALVRLYNQTGRREQAMQRERELSDLEAATRPTAR